MSPLSSKIRALVLGQLSGQKGQVVPEVGAVSQVSGLVVWFLSHHWLIGAGGGVLGSKQENLMRLQKWLCIDFALASLFQQKSPTSAIYWDLWPGRFCTLGTPDLGRSRVGLIVKTFCSVSLRGMRT